MLGGLWLEPPCEDLSGSLCLAARRGEESALGVGVASTTPSLTAVGRRQKEMSEVHLSALQGTFKHVLKKKSHQLPSELLCILGLEEGSILHKGRPPSLSPWPGEECVVPTWSTQLWAAVHSHHEGTPGGSR